MISYYHLQNDDEIKSGDEFYIDHSLIARWFPVGPHRIGEIYKAASMLPMRRKEAEPLPEKTQNKSGSVKGK